MNKMTPQTEDTLLIQKSLSGDKAALEQLLKKHQTWIYNVALNLTANETDAADLMQETLIKVITNLSKFEYKSSFQTWVYRILKNHFLNTKRSKSYSQVISWEEFGHGLDNTPDENLADTYDIDKKLLVEEAKLSCMKAMLLCLTPEQRLVFVMGELFEIPDRAASEILEITKANFRKKLSRTRQQLYGFMNNKCGLINPNNPCRCAKKTRGFIKKGYVDPGNLQFQKNAISRVEAVVEEKVATYENETHKAYQKLFQKHYYQEPKDQLVFLKNILSSELVRKTFDL